MKSLICICSCILFLATSIKAQQLQQKIEQYVQQNSVAMIDEYSKFLSVPNVSSDSANVKRNADFILQMMQQRGITGSLLHGATDGVNPAVYGEIKVPGATKTIGLYAHYDGQPVNAKQWTNGLQPFTPLFIDGSIEHGGKIIDYKKGDAVQPNWRITGRGSADDKAGVMTILNAFAALMQQGIAMKNNIKFLFEGEEEVGSTHLDEIFKANKEKLSADIWIIIDGPVDVSGRKVISFGVRGDVNVDLTVYGAKRPLHSGNYGNWAPNPAMRLVQLLAGMKDEDGKVLIPGFYDDVLPLGKAEKDAIANIPDASAKLAAELGIAKPDGNGAKFLDLLSFPTLNINGIQSANAGALAANIIPATAIATLDLRLVPGNTVEGQIKKVEDYIASKGYHIIDHDPTDAERAQYSYLIKITHDKGYIAQHTAMDLPIASGVIKAVQSTTNDPVILRPSSGGSLPLFMFEEILNAKVISVPVVNYDNNQHAENENVEIGFLWSGIETIAAIMMM